MSSFTSNAEYLSLCQKLVDQQYDEDALEDYNIQEMEWMPAEPVAKEKIINAHTTATIDLTNVKASEIKKQIYSLPVSKSVNSSFIFLALARFLAQKELKWQLASKYGKRRAIPLMGCLVKWISPPISTKTIVLLDAHGLHTLVKNVRPIMFLLR